MKFADQRFINNVFFFFFQYQFVTNISASRIIGLLESLDLTSQIYVRFDLFK